MSKEQLRQLITETLNEIGLLSNGAIDLLMGTAAQESRLGYYIKQVGKGPALGIMQMEPGTFRHHVKWLKSRGDDLQYKILGACNMVAFEEDSLRFNIKFSIAMARVHYYRRPESLPSNLKGMAEYWKKYYNTYLGAGTVEEFIDNYKKYVL